MVPVELSIQTAVVGNYEHHPLRSREGEAEVLPSIAAKVGK